jgi:hypothetical protein
VTTKDILRYGVELTAFTLSVFGGFLKQIAPPEEAGAAFAVGLASFISLIVLLFVVVISKGKSEKRRRSLWLRVALPLFTIALISAFVYKRNTEQLTFRYPPPNGDRYVAGTQLTPEGQRYWDSLQDMSQVVLKFGLVNRSLIWTPESILRARMLLTINYIVVVVSLTGTVFALSEGALAKRSSN